ncbi:unnamed protein product [Allacma fusca]|uniref:Uncharacterized protein n=1 Tax=Allacma fusca TaxID=39272 RepID=A0A8J2PH81_9HEXA|nr:unnamed protein product [Allacma fusca]
MTAGSVGREIFDLCACGATGNMAWFKVIAGQVALPPPPEAPQLVPGYDGGFDPHGTVSLYGIGWRC